MFGKHLSHRKSFKRFMHLLGATAVGLALTTQTSFAEIGEPEKEDLKFGFIKLTDMAPHDELAFGGTEYAR